ncbi:hypothetical protein T492DRAFT_891304 [Pavlovales sp. CCMP2436]|nr:hypothetical protein T492DRAFT_891304 [Pavlovales sp. CCMP2436]
MAGLRLASFAAADAEELLITQAGEEAKRLKEVGSTDGASGTPSFDAQATRLNAHLKAVLEQRDREREGREREGREREWGSAAGTARGKGTGGWGESRGAVVLPSLRVALEMVSAGVLELPVSASDFGEKRKFALELGLSAGAGSSMSQEQDDDDDEQYQQREQEQQRWQHALQ